MALIVVLAHVQNRSLGPSWDVDEHVTCRSYEEAVRDPKRKADFPLSEMEDLGSEPKWSKVCVSTASSLSGQREPSPRPPPAWLLQTGQEYVCPLLTG